jgi:hypothetical protein
MQRVEAIVNNVGEEKKCDCTHRVDHQGFIGEETAQHYVDVQRELVSIKKEIESVEERMETLFDSMRDGPVFFTVASSGQLRLNNDVLRAVCDTRQQYDQLKSRAKALEDEIAALERTAHPVHAVATISVVENDENWKGSVECNDDDDGGVESHALFEPVPPLMMVTWNPVLNAYCLVPASPVQHIIQ